MTDLTERLTHAGGYAVVSNNYYSYKKLSYRQETHATLYIS